MATVFPQARWRDPQTAVIDQAAPDAVLIATPGTGAHLTWMVTAAQLVDLHRQIAGLLDRREGGGS